jgi:uncharacterized oxidoreductase
MILTGRTILITGGTSGIGLGLAEAFYKLRNNVIIAGRRQELLDKITVANPGMHSIAVDMKNPDSIAAMCEEIEGGFPDLDMLVNNAGISRSENWSSNFVDIADALSIIETNIVSVVRLTAALLPLLRRQPAASIITTTSGLAFVPRAGFPTYCASKAFLHSWLQSLRYQLRRTSIEVLELAPPYVQTELGGAHQVSDPAAMPLADYVAEVIGLLGQPTSSDIEILVERVKALRTAERNGIYPQVYSTLNPE